MVELNLKECFYLQEVALENVTTGCDFLDSKRMRLVSGSKRIEKIIQDFKRQNEAANLNSFLSGKIYF